MANKICLPMYGVLEEDVVKVLVPDGEEYSAGEVVVLGGLSDISGNIEVYDAGDVSDHTADKLAIIVNGDAVEELADGRTPDGNPNITEYTVKAGEIATAIILKNNMRLFVSDDAVTGTPAADDVLIGADGSRVLGIAADGAAATAAAVNIAVEKKMNINMGGNHGMDVAATSVVKVTKA